MSMVIQFWLYNIIFMSKIPRIKKLTRSTAFFLVPILNEKRIKIRTTEYNYLFYLISSII